MLWPNRRPRKPPTSATNAFKSYMRYCSFTYKFRIKYYVAVSVQLS